MAFIGVIQTGDIDKAIACAQERIARGEHIFVKRHEYKIWPGEQEALEEYVLSERTYGHPLEHNPIEYEVYAEDKEYNEWLEEKEGRE